MRTALTEKKGPTAAPTGFWPCNPSTKRSPGPSVRRKIRPGGKRLNPAKPLLVSPDGAGPNDIRPIPRRPCDLSREEPYAS